MRNDGQLWQIYMQPYNENGIEGTIAIWKTHHSFGDGASAMSFTLALSEEYDRSYFLKSKAATLF